MAQAISFNNLTLRDSRGRTGRFGFYYAYTTADAPSALAAQASVAAIMAAAELLSNAAPVRLTGLAGALFDPSVYGVTDPYSAIEQKARLTFLAQTAGGAFPGAQQLTTVSIPAPNLADVFAADGTTVDQGATDVAAFLAAFLSIDAHGGRVVTKGGNAIAAFVSGNFDSRRMQRKLTIWQKTPDEAGPDE